MRYDYLVIGAGISGISSALLLARFGFKVAVLEQAPRPAPLVEGFVRNNVYFESGFHYAGGLEDGGVLDLNLRLLGVAGQLQKIPLEASAYDTVVQPESGFEFSFPQGCEGLIEALRQRFPDQAKALSKYFVRLQEVTRNLPYYSSPPQGATERMGLAALHDQSLSQVLDGLSIKGELRTLLQVHCLLHGSLPSEIPFAIHAGLVDGYYRSAQTFKGGGRALVAALVGTLKRSGVDLFCRHRVEEIELSRAGVLVGARCANGARVQASGCIVTLHPQALLKLLPESVFRPAYRHRLAALDESLGAEIVFLRRERQRGSTLGDSGRNFFFLPPQGKNVFDCCLPLSERLLYLNFPGSGRFPVSGGDCEGGVTAILPAPYYEKGDINMPSADYIEAKRSTGEQVRERIACLLPELGAGLQVECVATAKTLQEVNASTRGSLYGVKHMVGQFNPSAKTRLPGLFLSGQAIAAPGLLGAVTSALMTVGEIVGHDRLEALRGEIVGL